MYVPEPCQVVLNSIYFFHRFYYKLAFPEFNSQFQIYCIVLFEGELTSSPLKNKELEKSIDTFLCSFKQFSLATFAIFIFYCSMCLKVFLCLHAHLLISLNFMCFTTTSTNVVFSYWFLSGGAYLVSGVLLFSVSA